MAKTKLLSSIAIILLISSCAFLAGSFATARNGEISPIATGLPFPFATPTPTPSPTPEPTATPIPTPRPEPSAKPTITIDVKSSASANIPKVEISGTLSYNKTGVSITYVYVGYSADGGNSWKDFSLAQTNTDGSFDAIWIPNATGSYMLCAQYLGNLTLHWMNATVNLAMLPDLAGNEFSVVSNSTISNVAYDSATQQLSFSTNGTSGTNGYAQICIPKTLASDYQALEVKLDGEKLAFGSQSSDDVWVISCVYTQSEHAFTVQIPFAEILSPTQTPWLTILAIIILIVVVVAVVVVVRRRRRTAATVAAILKEKRSTY